MMKRIPLITLFLAACSNDDAALPNHSIELVNSAPEPFIGELASTDISGSTEIECDAAQEQLALAMLQAVNTSRNQARNCGGQQMAATTALTWNGSLETAANQHSNDMAENNFFSHTGSDGLGIAERAVRSGYNFRGIGENIAAGQSSVVEAHDGWLDSPGHCANIMNPEYTEMGAACSENPNADYRRYWTVVFGRPGD